MLCIAEARVQVRPGLEGVCCAGGGVASPFLFLACCSSSLLALGSVAGWMHSHPHTCAVLPAVLVQRLPLVPAASPTLRMSVGGTPLGRRPSRGPTLPCGLAVVSPGVVLPPPPPVHVMGGFQKHFEILGTFSAI